jgi:hypothetical protein
LHECDRLFKEDKAVQKLVVIYSRNYAVEESEAMLNRMKTRLAVLDKSIHICAVLVDFPMAQKPVQYWDIIDAGYKSRYSSPNPRYANKKAI